MTELQLAPPLESYGTPSTVSEAELVRAYHRSEEARPCACGDVVIADPAEPTAGVAEHQATPKHVAWRAWREL